MGFDWTRFDKIQLEVNGYEDEADKTSRNAGNIKTALPSYRGIIWLWKFEANDEWDVGAFVVRVNWLKLGLKGVKALAYRDAAKRRSINSEDKANERQVVSLYANGGFISRCWKCCKVKEGFARGDFLSTHFWWSLVEPLNAGPLAVHRLSASLQCGCCLSFREWNSSFDTDFSSRRFFPSTFTFFTFRGPLSSWTAKCQ